MIKIGFESYSTEGPGIFLTRLKRELEAQSRFNYYEPDVWIQLSFQSLPEHIRQRKVKGKTRIVVRMDGCYCSRWNKIRKPVQLSIPILDDWYSAKVNYRKNSLIRENLIKSDHIVFQSEFARKLTWKFVCKTRNGTVIPNGIDLLDFSPDGKKLINKPECLNIIVAHSFRPYHRLHDAFRIFAALKRIASLPCHLHIIGGDDGRSFSFATEIAQGKGLLADKDYTFWGKQPFDMLPSIYRGGDLMLNLSYRDICPNVVIEALACGLPVVGVKAGGVPELVGNAGILVEEHIPMTYLDSMNLKRTPKAPTSAYLEAILEVKQNLLSLKEKARKRAISTLDIRLVASRYIKVCEQVASYRSI